MHKLPAAPPKPLDCYMQRNGVIDHASPCNCTPEMLAAEDKPVITAGFYTDAQRRNDQLIAKLDGIEKKLDALLQVLAAADEEEPRMTLDGEQLPPDRAEGREL